MGTAMRAGTLQAIQMNTNDESVAECHQSRLRKDALSMLDQASSCGLRMFARPCIARSARYAAGPLKRERKHIDR